MEVDRSTHHLLVGTGCNSLKFAKAGWNGFVGSGREGVGVWCSNRVPIFTSGTIVGLFATGIENVTAFQTKPK